MNYNAGLNVSPASELAVAVPGNDSRSLLVVLPILIVGVAYYLGCLAGFALRFPGSGISFFWPPTAVLATAFLLTRPRSWMPLLAGAFVAHAVAHALNGVPIAAWPIQFVGNASQAAFAAWIVRRYAGTTDIFANSTTVIIFLIGACLIAPAAASIIPSFVYVQLGWADDFAQAFRNRTVSNAIASLTLIPSLVVLWTYATTRRTIAPRRLLEFAVLLFGIVAANFPAIYMERTDVLGLSVAVYVTAPLLLWATVRFGGSGFALALLGTTLFTVIAAQRGQGPLFSQSPADTVIGVQLLLTANAVPMMLIAGLLEQNRGEHRALIDVEQQNSAILRALPDLMFLLNRDGIWLHCYPNAAAEARPRFASVEGKHLRDMLPADVANAFLQAVHAVTPDAPSVIEFTCDIGGERRRLEGRFTGVDEERVLTVVRDVTERWQSESALRDAKQRYALATAAGGIGVWELNVPDGAVRLEGNVSDLLGYTPEEICTHLRDWERIISDADRDEVHTRLMAFIDGTSASFETEFRVIHKDGSTRWIASKGAVTDRQDGKPLRVRGTFIDITERKVSARALADANEALIRTDRVAAVAAFSASIAHELSQPLTAIAANASASLRQLDSTDAAPDARLQHALNDVLNDCRRANHIVERTRAMFANHPAQKVPLDINAVVRDILEMVHGRMREYHVRTTALLDEGAPTVVGDAVQLKQVLLNLIVNAADSMHDVPFHRRRLHISTRAGRNVAFISVRDTGKGLPPEDARRLFDPFYTTKSTGTGIGLAICRSIVESHGGSLWAIRNAEGGATFRFRIPLHEPQRRTG